MLKIEGKIADDKGKEAESIAYQLAQISFLKDLCFLTPKLPNGKELCDLLIIFNDTMFIWQIKDVRLSEDLRYKDKPKRKNKNQLIGAYKSLFVNKLMITLPNYGNIDPSKFKHIFLFSVFMGNPELCTDFFEEYKNHLIHVINKRDLEIIVNELDTVSDFINYFILKQEKLKNSANCNIFINGGERELLAYYLINNRNLLFENNDFIILENIYEPLVESLQYQTKKQADQISKLLWDEHFINGAVEINVDKKILIELLKPTRAKRRLLTSIFFDMRNKAENNSLHMLKRYSYHEGSDSDTAYCFMYFNMSENDSDETIAREFRIGCAVTKYKFPQTIRVLGIADLKRDNKFGTSLCVYDGPALTSEEFESYKNIPMHVIESNSIHIVNTE